MAHDQQQHEQDEDKNENVVIIFFDDEEKADDAIEGLEQWDKINESFKLGTIGTITKEGDKVKTHVGRKTGKGVAVGATVGVIGAVLTGGASLIAGAVGAGALGGVTGHFFKKSLHLTKQEVEQIGQELDGGRVAVVVTCDEHEIDPVTEYMNASHGEVRVYKVPEEALHEAAASLDEHAGSAEGDADKESES